MGNAEALVLLTHLRFAGSVAKVDTTVEIAAELCEQGAQVVIFVAFKESGYEIAKKLHCPFLYGDVPQGQRQPMIDRFQKGDRRALVCTFETGGLGITLTAAQTVILVDRPWTPAMAEQAEDRLHRIGQRNAVTSLWLCLGDIDTIIDDLLLTKKNHIDKVVNGKNVRFDNSKSIGEQAKAILETIFS